MAASRAHSHQLCFQELDRSSGRLVIPTSHPVQESLGQITSRWQLGLCGAPPATAEPACQSAAAFVLGESVLTEGFDLEPNYVSWVSPLSLPRVLVLCCEAVSLGSGEWLPCSLGSRCSGLEPLGPARSGSMARGTTSSCFLYKWPPGPHTLAITAEWFRVWA